MSQLFNEFYYQVFGIYNDFTSKFIEERDLKYDFIRKDNTTKYYTKDGQHNLICTQYHEGYDKYEFEFTGLAFNYYKQLILEYNILKFNEYFNNQFNTY